MRDRFPAETHLLQPLVDNRIALPFKSGKLRILEPGMQGMVPGFLMISGCLIPGCPIAFEYIFSLISSLPHFLIELLHGHVQ